MCKIGAFELKPWVAEEMKDSETDQPAIEKITRCIAVYQRDRTTFGWVHWLINQICILFKIIIGRSYWKQAVKASIKSQLSIDRQNLRLVLKEISLDAADRQFFQTVLMSKKIFYYENVNCLISTYIIKNECKTAQEAKQLKFTAKQKKKIQDDYTKFFNKITHLLPFQKWQGVLEQAQI